MILSILSTKLRCSRETQSRDSNKNFSIKSQWLAFTEIYLHVNIKTDANNKVQTSQRSDLEPPAITAMYRSCLRYWLNNDGGAVYRTSMVHWLSAKRVPSHASIPKALSFCV